MTAFWWECARNAGNLNMLSTPSFVSYGDSVIHSQLTACISLTDVHTQVTLSVQLPQQRCSACCAMSHDLDAL